MNLRHMKLRHVFFALLIGAGPVQAQDLNAVFLNASREDDTAVNRRENVATELRTGYRSLTGLGVPADPARAASLFARLVEKKRSSAAVAWLGHSYVAAPELGKAAEGLSLLREAAASGDPVGKTFLGRAFEEGRVVPRDLSAAKRLYTEAAPAFALAKTYLADMYLRSTNATPADYETAHELLLNASGTGEPKAMVDLAYMHMHGLLGSKNLTRAAEWLDRAAQLGYWPAVYQRGIFFSKGLGERRSRQVAASMFRRAAEAGYAPAQAALGMCYATGNGVPRNLSDALKWLERAAPFDVFAAKQLPHLRAHASRRNLQGGTEQ